MTFWNKLDLEVMEMREKIIEFTDEFNKKNGTKIPNYTKKLNGFLDRRLRKQSDLILKKQIFMTLFSLKILNRYL